MTSPVPDRPSTAGLIGDAIKQSSALFSAELRLARLEVTEKLTGALVAVVSVALAAICLLIALIFLLQAIVATLVTMGWSAPLANLAVGGGLFLIAIIAIAVAARKLSNVASAPSRTLGQIQSASAIVKGGRA